MIPKQDKAKGRYSKDGLEVIVGEQETVNDEVGEVRRERGKKVFSVIVFSWWKQVAGRTCDSVEIYWKCSR